MAYYTDWGEVQPSQLPFIPARYPAYLEKEFMNPFRYNLNHRMIPGFGVLAVICGVVCVILMNNDNWSNLPYAIGVLVFMLTVFGGMMIYIKKTAKKELRLEIGRWDLKHAGVPKQDSYVIAYDNGDVELTREGYRYRGQFHTYEEAAPRLATSNMFNRVWVALQLGEDKKRAVFLHLDPTVIKAIRELKIPISNQRELDYMVGKKEMAFAQIYSTGKFYVLD